MVVMHNWLIVTNVTVLIFIVPSSKLAKPLRMRNRLRYPGTSVNCQVWSYSYPRRHIRRTHICGGAPARIQPRRCGIGHDSAGHGGGRCAERAELLQAGKAEGPGDRGEHERLCVPMLRGMVF